MKGRKPKNYAVATHIGQQIKAGRIRKGWTQQKLGENSGLSQKMISAYERGVSVPPASDFCLMISVLDIPCQRLVSQISEMCIDAEISKQKRKEAYAPPKHL